VNDAVPTSHLVEWMRELLPESPEAADVISASVRDNPGRIDRAYADLLSGYGCDPAEIVRQQAQPVSLPGTCVIESQDVPFISLCPHHCLPFIGTVDIVYQPGGLLLGLGKLARLVACRSRRFQLQETLSREIAQDIMEHGAARGVRVVATARHTCICYRGPDAVPVVNRTSYWLGDLAAPAPAIPEDGGSR
jgi:GTP cyclohydrolase I